MSKMTTQFVDLLIDIRDMTIIGARSDFLVRHCTIEECFTTAAKLAPQYQREELHFKEGAKKGKTNVVFGMIHDATGNEYSAIVTRTSTILLIDDDIREFYSDLPTFSVMAALLVDRKKKH